MQEVSSCSVWLEYEAAFIRNRRVRILPQAIVAIEESNAEGVCNIHLIGGHTIPVLGNANTITQEVSAAQSLQSEQVCIPESCETGPKS